MSQENEHVKSALTVKKQYVYADKVANFETTLDTLLSDCIANSVPVTANFESGEFPAGRDLAVIPLKTKAAKGVPARIREVLLIAVPSLNELRTDEKLSAEAESFMRQTIAAKLCSKAVAAANKADAILPASLADFIITKRSGGVMSGFNDIASHFVAFLHELGFPASLDKSMLRECLSNAAAAQQWFSSIDQSGWLAIIDKMQAYAESQDLPTEIYDTWRETRNDQTFEIKNENILSALKNLKTSA